VALTASFDLEKKILMEQINNKKQDFYHKNLEFFLTIFSFVLPGSSWFFLQK